MTTSLQVLRPDWPAPNRVQAFATTRAGGASTGPFASLNLGDHVGDAPEAVAVNRARLRAACSLPAEPIWLTQVHGTDVVEASSVASGVTADGARTDRPQVVCAVLTADCLPVLICNRQGTEVAALHAGWRGLAAGMIGAGLKALRSPAEDLLVWLGPAIGAAAYEVGDEVRAAFVQGESHAASAFTPSRPRKWTMDLYAVARQHLTRHGVVSIYGGAYCTATQPERFYSHRRDGVTGRMASLIWLA